MGRPQKVRIKVHTLRKLKAALNAGDLNTVQALVNDCLDLEHLERVRKAKRELYEARESGEISPSLYDYLYKQLEDSLP